jgi:hypothetical protein
VFVRLDDGDETVAVREHGREGCGEDDTRMVVPGGKDGYQTNLPAAGVHAEQIKERRPRLRRRRELT